MGLFLVSW